MIKDIIMRKKKLSSAWESKLPFLRRQIADQGLQQSVRMAPESKGRRRSTGGGGFGVAVKPAFPVAFGQDDRHTIVDRSYVELVRRQVLAVARFLGLGMRMLSVVITA
jgi:hypothetical protein